MQNLQTSTVNLPVLHSFSCVFIVPRKAPEIKCLKPSHIKHSEDWFCSYTTTPILSLLPMFCLASRWCRVLRPRLGFRHSLAQRLIGKAKAHLPGWRNHSQLHHKLFVFTGSGRICIYSPVWTPTCHGRRPTRFYSQLFAVFFLLFVTKFRSVVPNVYSRMGLYSEFYWKCRKARRSLKEGEELLSER